jgi:hypothetical protein
MSRPTLLPLVLAIGVPRWLVVMALGCWAVLSGPSYAQPLVKESTAPGFDSRSSIGAADRTPSFQTTDRRHDATSGNGNPNQLATSSIAIAAIGLSAIHLAKFFFDAPVAQQPRSPAQPRAPPAGAQRSH